MAGKQRETRSSTYHIPWPWFCPNHYLALAWHCKRNVLQSNTERLKVHTGLNRFLYSTFWTLKLLSMFTQHSKRAEISCCQEVQTGLLLKGHSTGNFLHQPASNTGKCAPFSLYHPPHQSHTTPAQLGSSAPPVTSSPYNYSDSLHW